MAFSSYLLVKAWEPNFDLNHDDINTTPVWIRFHGLPLNLYHRAILLGIGSGLGGPVRVDATTERIERAKYARVCVEVDLRRPLKPGVMVNGVRYSVTYEKLGNICGFCGMYGHQQPGCAKRRATEGEQDQEGADTAPESTTGVGDNPAPPSGASKPSMGPGKQGESSEGRRVDSEGFQLVEGHSKRSERRISDTPASTGKWKPVAAAKSSSMETKNAFATLGKLKGTQESRQNGQGKGKEVLKDSGNTRAGLDTKKEMGQRRGEKTTEKPEVRTMNSGEQVQKENIAFNAAETKTTGLQKIKLKPRRPPQPTKDLIFGPPGGFQEFEGLDKRMRTGKEKEANQTGLLIKESASDGPSLIKEPESGLVPRVLEPNLEQQKEMLREVREDQGMSLDN